MVVSAKQVFNISKMAEARSFCLSQVIFNVLGNAKVSQEVNGERVVN